MASYRLHFAMSSIPPEETTLIGVVVANFLFKTYRWAKAMDLITECLVLLNTFSVNKEVFLVFKQAIYPRLSVSGGHLHKRGLECYVRGQFKHSIQCHKIALHISEIIGNRSGEAWSHFYLGKALDAVCQYNKTIDHYQKALAVPAVTGVERQYLEGMVYNNLGEVHHARGSHDKARFYYEKGLRISKANGNKIEESVSYNNLGVIYHDVFGKLDEALVYHQKALEIRKEFGYKDGEAVSYGNIGGVHFERGEYQKALEYKEKSLKISKEIGNRRSEGQNLLHIGKAYYRLGQYKRATEYTERALEILSEIGDRRNEGGVHGDLGHLYRDQGNYEKAKEHFGQALEIFEETGHLIGKAICYNNIGMLYASLGDHEKTLEYINRAVDIFKANGNKIGLGKAYSTIGGVYDSAGKYMKSREYFEEALKISRESGDRNGEALSTHGLGSIHLAIGEYNKAIAYAKKALSITQEIGERKSQISHNSLLGCAYLSQGDTEKSYLYLHKALELLKEIGIRDRELFLSVIEPLSLASAFERDYSKACDFLLEGISNHQYTRGPLKNDLDKLSLDSSSFACYNTLSLFLIAQRKVKDALFILELGRSRALVDLISEKYGMHRATNINEARLDTLQSLFQNQKSNLLFIAVLPGMIALWFVDRSGNIQFKKGKEIDVGEARFGVDISVLEEQGVQSEDRSLSALYDDELDNVEQGNKTQQLSTRKGDQSNRNIKSCCHYAHLYNDLIPPIIDLIEGPEIIIAPEGRFFMEPFAAFQDEMESTCPKK